jgi:hypothetical protein
MALKQPIKPLYVECYQHEGVTLWMNSGDPIKARIAKDTIISAEGVEWGKLSLMTYAGFWILEGLVYSHDLSPESYPTLSFYIEHREGLSMVERWQLYSENVESDELDILHSAYEATRRNVLKTMEDLPPQEKKSE